jgi:hypothetical protein
MPRTQWPTSPENSTLSTEAIREKLDEADANPGNIEFQTKPGPGALSLCIAQQDVALLDDSIRLLERARRRQAGRSRRTDRDWEMHISISVISKIERKICDRPSTL